MYDVFILCLMLAGISAVVVYSYKIFRSRVYPVGMVRGIPAIQECEDATASILPDFETAPEQDHRLESGRSGGQTPSKSEGYFGASDHPEFNELCALFIAGELTEQEVSRLEEHLSECPDCLRYLEKLPQKAAAAMGELAPKRAPEDSTRKSFDLDSAKKRLLERLPEREDSRLEGEVVEHGEALKRHSKQFEDFEKRLRRLELESVQKVQEGTEEKSQPPLIVH